MPMVFLRPMVTDTTWENPPGTLVDPTLPWTGNYAQDPADAETLNANWRALYSLVNGHLCFSHMRSDDQYLVEANIRFGPGSTAIHQPIPDQYHNHDGNFGALLGPNAIFAGDSGNLGNESYGAVRSMSKRIYYLFRTRLTIPVIGGAGIGETLNFAPALPYDPQVIGAAPGETILAAENIVRTYVSFIYPDAEWLPTSQLIPLMLFAIPVWTTVGGRLVLTIEVTNQTGTVFYNVDLVVTVVVIHLGV